MISEILFMRWKILRSQFSQEFLLQFLKFSPRGSISIRLKPSAFGGFDGALRPQSRSGQN